MSQHADKNLRVIESELNFVRCHVKNILARDFVALDETEIVLSSTLRVLRNHRPKLERPHEEARGTEPLAA